MPSTPGKNNGSETPIKTAPTKKPGKFSKLFAEVAKEQRAWLSLVLLSGRF